MGRYQGSRGVVGVDTALLGRASSMNWTDSKAPRVVATSR